MAHAAIPDPSARRLPYQGRWPRSPAMTTGRSGGSQEAELDRLRRQYPRWWIWRGRTTGDYWAMPPAGHPAARELISASDLGELARRLAQSEGRSGQSG